MRITAGRRGEECSPTEMLLQKGRSKEMWGENSIPHL